MDGRTGRCLQANRMGVFALNNGVFASEEGVLVSETAYAQLLREGVIALTKRVFCVGDGVDELGLTWASTRDLAAARKSARCRVALGAAARARASCVRCCCPLSTINTWRLAG